ncbi:LysR family transcriptional regulator [Niallia sp. 03190]|uniref:LysR family transcriptional regulator n=1 Tax=Niallia sp. 03190 TaxID=3458061 RepID=UPI00404468D3
MDYHLLTFVTVVEKQNFTRAAEALHITQSAVTLSIKSLEKKYNAKFLDRTNKYVRLTNAGEILYKHAKKILTQYEQVERLIENTTDVVSGPLIIGSSYTFGEYLLPRYIADFINENKLVNPKITIRNSNTIVSQLLRGELNIGIVDGMIESHPNLSSTPFAKDEMVVIVDKDHPLARYEEVDLEDLYEETWIIREEGSGSRQTIDQLFNKFAFSPPVVRSFGSTQIIKESVEAGLGISIVSKFAIQKETCMQTIIPLKIKNTSIIRTFSYVVPKTKFRARSVDLFLKKLKDNKIIKKEIIYN